MTAMLSSLLVRRVLPGALMALGRGSHPVPVHPAAGVPWWWVFLLPAGAGVLSAVLLRRKPLPAMGLLLVGILAAAMAPDAREKPVEVMLLVLLVLSVLQVCFVAATSPRQTSIVAAAMTLGALAGDATAPASLPPSILLAVALTAVIAWLTGHSIRQGHVHGEALRAQAQAQAVTAERLRIARELHDMVAHSIGIIAIQAGVGSRVIATQPAEARSALDADLGRLAATTLDAGVPVEVRWLGQRRPLPADIDLSAFRIIQEAVTNVVRHAGAGRCQVSIDCRHEELAIEVTDDGCGAINAERIAGPGYGIVGMRERAALLGGQFTAGPRPGGGFRVAARLPVPAAAR